MPVFFSNSIKDAHFFPFFSPIKVINLKNTECQTDPVKDEAFDWDLSDKTDCETQTVPPTRANSTVGGLGLIDLLQDAIVQTDQRLVFLLRRSNLLKQPKRRQTPVTSASKHASLTDAWVQTYVEVQEVGIQVEPEDFPAELSRSAAIKGMLASRQNSHHQVHPCVTLFTGFVVATTCRDLPVCTHFLFSPSCFQVLL